MARDVPAPKWLLTMIMPIAFVLLAFRFMQVGWHILHGDQAEAELGARDVPSSLAGKTDVAKDDEAGEADK
jgi:TRAP-type C4-dicarboxylate transport system permease small subunit